MLLLVHVRRVGFDRVHITQLNPKLEHAAPMSSSNHASQSDFLLSLLFVALAKPGIAVVSVPAVEDSNEHGVKPLHANQVPNADKAVFLADWTQIATHFFENIGGGEFLRNRELGTCCLGSVVNIALVLAGQRPGTYIHFRTGVFGWDGIESETREWQLAKRLNESAIDILCDLRNRGKIDDDRYLLVVLPSRDFVLYDADRVSKDDVHGSFAALGLAEDPDGITYARTARLLGYPPFRIHPTSVPLSDRVQIRVSLSIVDLEGDPTERQFALLYYPEYSKEDQLYAVQELEKQGQVLGELVVGRSFANFTVESVWVCTTPTDVK
jgi:hypothetical protein